MCLFFCSTTHYITNVIFLQAELPKNLLRDNKIRNRDKTIKINVLASVSIINEQKYIYIDKVDNAEEKAILLAEAHFSDSEIVSLSVEKYGKDKEFIYEVSVKRRIIIHAG